MKDLMQAVSIREPGAPEVLQPVTVPVPDLGEFDVLVEVSAAGVNRPDGCRGDPGCREDVIGFSGRACRQWSILNRFGIHVCSGTPHMG